MYYNLKISVVGAKLLPMCNLFRGERKNTLRSIIQTMSTRDGSGIEKCVIF